MLYTLIRREAYIITTFPHISDFKISTSHRVVVILLCFGYNDKRKGKAYVVSGRELFTRQIKNMHSHEAGTRKQFPCKAYLNLEKY